MLMVGGEQWRQRRWRRRRRADARPTRRTTRRWSSRSPTTSPAQERHEHEGRRQPAARADGPARRHEGVRPDRQDRRLGGRAGQDGQGLDVQRHRCPGPMIKVADGDKVAHRPEERAAAVDGVHLHGIEMPNAMDGVPFITQDPIKPGEIVHLRLRRPRARPSACTTRTTTRSARSPTAWPARSSSATSRCPPATDR